MPLTKLRKVLLFVATLCAGLMAGLFALYAHTIMPGLGRTDDRTFVGAFQEIDRSIEATPFVASVFFGGGLLTAATLWLARGHRVAWWIGAALALTVVAIAITALVNVPLNHQIRQAGDPAVIDVAQAREDFREDWWRTWNLVRVGTSLGAFACLSWSLTLLNTDADR